MRYAKTLGLLALAMTALMAFASNALATYATSPAGTTYTGEIKATNESAHVSLHGPSGSGVTIECSVSEVAGKIETHGLPETHTLKGKITALTFGIAGNSTACTNGYSVHVTEKGEIEAHTTTAGTSNGDATVTSNGTKVLVTTPLGFNCTYKTANTDIGWLTGSNKTGGTATFDISATIPVVAGESSIFCGAHGIWTGNYLINTPDYLYIH